MIRGHSGDPLSWKPKGNILVHPSRFLTYEGTDSESGKIFSTFLILGFLPKIMLT